MKSIGMFSKGNRQIFEGSQEKMSEIKLNLRGDE